MSEENSLSLDLNDDFQIQKALDDVLFTFALWDITYAGTDMWQRILQSYENETEPGEATQAENQDRQRHIQAKKDRR